MKNLLLLLITFAFLSCSKGDKNVAPSQESLIDQQILQDIEKQPTITATAINQKPFKRMAMKGQFENNGPIISSAYDFEYTVDNKILSIKSEGKDVLDFTYQPNKLSVKSGNQQQIIILDNEGFAQNGIGLDKIYYKNGYLLRSTGVNGFKQTYSPEGNLLFREADNLKVIYEYTDFSNTIRQEVINSTAIHWTFRDSYLGKFSTNLLKKVSYLGITTILEYSYQFDEQNRVKVMTIKRTSDFNMENATFEYMFTY